MSNFENEVAERLVASLYEQFNVIKYLKDHPPVVSAERQAKIDESYEERWSDLIWHIAHSEALPDEFPKALISACRRYYTFLDDTRLRDYREISKLKEKIINLLEIYIVSKDFEI